MFGYGKHHSLVLILTLTVRCEPLWWLMAIKSYWISALCQSKWVKVDQRAFFPIVTLECFWDRGTYSAFWCLHEHFPSSCIQTKSLYLLSFVFLYLLHVKRNISNTLNMLLNYIPFMDSEYVVSSAAIPLMFWLYSFMQLGVPSKFLPYICSIVLDILTRFDWAVCVVILKRFLEF